MSNKELETLSRNNMTIPDYLKDEKVGQVGNLEASDFKIPRIKLLQGLSPELRSFPDQAKVGQFWHTGVNMNLGSKMEVIICTVLKRVTIWSSREPDSEMLAYSPDGRKWSMGGNQTFEFTPKQSPKIKIHTKSDVNSSGLLNWGTSNPLDPKSTPVAVLMYEYLLYMPEFPEFSPCILGVSRTGINNAVKLNTSLLMFRKPIQSLGFWCSAEEQVDGKQVWHVPNFKRIEGFVDKNHYDNAKLICSEYADRATREEPVKQDKPIDDEIPF